MESNGQKGRVHISQTTAQELIKSGKSSYIVERDDKITAKGKGVMTTYWLVDKGVDQSSSGSESRRSAVDTVQLDDIGHGSIGRITEQSSVLPIETAVRVEKTVEVCFFLQIAWLICKLSMPSFSALKNTALARSSIEC